MSLQTIFDALKAQGQTVTLNDASLGTSGLDALLKSDLQISSIQVSLSGALQPPTNQLQFSGTSTFLYADGNGLVDCNPAQVTVTITEPAATPVLSITVSLDSNWTLGSSFFPLFGSSFDNTVITSPQLIFGFGNGQDSDGIVLSSGLSLVGPLAPLPLLFATPPSGLSISGKITLTDDGPCFQLTSEMPDLKGGFGLIDLTSPSYTLQLAWTESDDPDDDKPLPNITNALQGNCSIIASYPVPMTATIPQSGKTLSVTFGGDPNARPLSSTNLLEPIFNNPDFAKDLSPSLFGANMPFGLKEIGVQVSLDKLANPISTWGMVGTTQAWYPIPGVNQFSILPLDISWNVVDPMGDANLFGLVQAGITIGSYEFDIEVSYPDFMIAGHLPGGIELDLTNMNAQLFTQFPNNQVPKNPDLSVSTLTFGEFDIIIAPNASPASFQLSCQATASIQLGSIELGLDSGWMEITLNFPKSGGIDGEFKINGIFSVNQWQFSLSADIKESGLQFEGSLLQPQTIEIGQLLHNLLGGSISGPSGWDMSVTLQTFDLNVDTEQALLDVNGALDWKLTVLGTVFDPKFVAHVTSTGKGSQRKWSGALAGGIELAGMSFGVGYQFGPKISVLSGAWHSGSYDWTQVMSSFGQSQPGMPASIPSAQQPNLAAGESLIVSYDFNKKVFTLLGSAVEGKGTFEGFFIAVSGQGFAAGIAFELEPGFFASLNSSLSMFDDFGLSQLALAIANFNSPYQNLPISSGLQGVASGINFYALFESAKADDTTQSAMTLLTGGQQQLQVWIAFTNQSDGWAFKFKGDVKNASLDLGSSVTLTGASLGLTAATGATGFSFSVVFDLMLTAKPGSGRIIVPDGSTDVLTFLGEIGFAGSQESFGGFMAAFMEGTWQDPFNFSGLQVSNIGLLLGVGVVADVPVPSIGMTGFLVFATPDLDFEFDLVIYFNGANPEQSLFIGSVNNLNAIVLIDMLLWAAAGVEVPSLLQNVLSSYGIDPIPIDVGNFQTDLKADDFAQLNSYVISDNVTKLFDDAGHPLTPNTAGAPYQTLILALKDSERAAANTTWFIADFQMGRVYCLTTNSLQAPFTFTLTMNPWLYVVPADTTLGPFTYKQGFGFGGELNIAGMKLDVIAELLPSKGLSIDASAPAPFSWPVCPIPGITLPKLLTFSDPQDSSKGPSLSLSTYQQGSVPPHFYLNAKVSLLSLADFETQIKILASGFSFEAALDALDILNAKLSCKIDDSGFAASGAFSLDLDVDTNSVEIGGVTVIPAIHLSTGFAIGLGINFPTSSQDPNQSAGFSGSISFYFEDQSFSASFSFTLSDLNNLVSSIKDWIVNNIGELLKELLTDIVQWAKALANGLFELTTELAAKALQALGAAVDDIAKLLGNIGRSMEEIYDALVNGLKVPVDLAIRAITKAFVIDLTYAGIGQHIGPSSGMATPQALISWMQNTAAPAFASGNWDGLSLDGAGLLTAFNANVLNNAIVMETALYDPGMYEMHLKGFGIDVMMPYAKISDNLGVFQIQIPPTQQPPGMGFGPFAFTSPAISVAVWTDGGFLLDYGYPDGGDWNRAGSISLPIAGIAAQGGFRLQRLSPTIGLPAAWSNVTIAVEIDAAFKLSLSGGIDVGILSGGFWMSYGGGFTALAGYGKGISPTSSGSIDPRQPAEFAGSLWTGYSAGIYGSVDFGLIAASVHIALSGAIGVGLAPGNTVELSVTATVSVGAEIKIRLLIVTITISFHFDTTLTIGNSLPWSQGEYLLALSNDEGDLLPLPLAKPAPLLRASVPSAKAPLSILFLPELTNAYDSQQNANLQIVLGLGIPYVAATPTCDFNHLCQALIQWAASHAGLSLTDESGGMSGANLRRIASRLSAKPRLSRLYKDIPGAGDPDTQLDYKSLITFLADNFSITVRAATASDQSAATFPMIPGLNASVTVNKTTSKLVDFTQYNQQPSDYENAIEQVFQRFKVFGAGSQLPMPAPGDDSQSLATYVFIAYFEYLLQGAISEAAQQPGVPANKLVFDNTAAGLTTSFRGGLQLPQTASSTTYLPMQQLTGQQQAVANFSPSLTAFTLSLGQTESWFTLGVTGTDFDNATLSQFQATKLKAPLTLLNPSQLVSSPTSYMLGSFTSLAANNNATWTLAPLPQSLTQVVPANGLPVILAYGQPQAPTPVATGFTWASSIDLKLTQVPDGDGGFSSSVFQLTGIDEEKLAAIASLLAGLSGQPVSLALAYNGPSGLQLSSTTPANIALLRTNLSIAIQPPTLLAAKALGSEDGPVTAGTMADPLSFLTILNAYGETNATGYYLAFQTPDKNLNGLFSTGTSATVSLLARRTNSGTAQATTVLPSDDALLFTGKLSTDQTYFVQAAQLPSYQPANAPGTVKLQVTRPNPALTDSDGSDQQAVDLLYNLFTAEVAGQGYDNLGYAPSASPAVDPSDASKKTWLYTLALPLNKLLSGGGSANPYAAIGTSPTLTFQLRDCFGNAIQNPIAVKTVQQLYCDPIVGPSAWLGTSLNWQASSSPQSLTVTMSANQACLDANAPSAEPIYQQAAWQLSQSADIAFSLTCSLDSSGGYQLPASATSQIAAFVSAILAYLGDKTKTLPQPVVLTYKLAGPVDAIPPQAISVALTEKRIRNVDSSAAALLPAIVSSSCNAAPDLSTGLSAFAATFEKAFANYKLGSASGLRQSTELWAVGLALTQPSLGSSQNRPAYFAPAPLYGALQSGNVPVPDFGDFKQGSGWPSYGFAYSAIDCDQLLDGVFADIDRLLAGPFAAAAYELSQPTYAALVQARSTLAQNYSQNQLTWLFQEQTGSPNDPNLFGARENFAQSLQLSLSNAYAIDAVLALPASWTGLPAGQGGQLALYGSVGPAASSATNIPPVPTLLPLGDDGATGTLYYAFRPGNLSADAEISVNLVYSVTHVALTPEDAAPTWITLALPTSAAIQTPGDDGTEIPIVNRFFPTTPTLGQQTAEPYATGGGQTSLADLLKWNYGAGVILAPVAQDTTSIDIAFNLASSGLMRGGLGASALTLDQALVMFKQCYQQIEPKLGDVISGSADAANILAALQTALQALTTAAWPVPTIKVRDADLKTSSAVNDTRLSVTLSQDEASSATWLMTVKTLSSGPAASLAALPLLANGQPQPQTMVVSTSPDYVVSYQPVDPKAAVMVAIGLDGLDVRFVQSAQANIQVSRNVSFIPGLTTNPCFVFQTPKLTFPTPVTPALEGPSQGIDIASIVQPPASGQLADWLNGLLTTTFGTAPNPQAQVRLGYEFPAFVGQNQGVARSALAPSPYLMSRKISVNNNGQDGDATPAGIASAMAQPYVAWASLNPLRKSDGFLTADLTLYSNFGQGNAALLHLPNLSLALNAISDIPSPS